MIKNRREAITILIFTIIVVIATVSIAIIYDKIFVYGGTVISLIWLIKSIRYLIKISN